ncbi:MAG TPA: response regulator, partial [Burkholderiales bacterium]
RMQSRLSALQDRHEAFDPLEFDRFTRFQELTRMMAEGVNDVATVQQNLLKHVSDTEVALLQQARLNRELQQELLRVRAVPFASYAERYYRTVRQAARDLGREARLTLSGAEIEIDRGVLEKVSAPIEHMLRNALAHGIEPPEARRALGKPEAGTVSLALKQEGNQVSITLSDDGAGLDPARIRARAVELGLLAQGQAVSDSQAMQLIFTPGFSTAAELTEVSGRGVGMDVVRSEVTSLGGRVEVVSEPGRGTRFTLYLPLTLAVAQVVLVRAGPRSYALPSPMVEQVRQVKPEELKALYEARQVEFRDNTYPFHYLPRLLGDEEAVPEARRFSPVLLLKSGLQRAAVHADDLTSNQEVVVKNIGPQLSRVAGIEGATVLGTGQVVLIINPVHLAARGELLRAVPARVPAAPGQPAAAAPVVMVVDDSLTVRKITGRLLAREGYQVMTAKDGLDALQQVEETVPDVMLVDIEMPRMDGFDLTRHLRAGPRTAAVPIIMITSRTAEKHRAYAREVGVDVYLGKPYQEEELLQHVAGFVKRRSPAG